MDSRIQLPQELKDSIEILDQMEIEESQVVAQQYNQFYIDAQKSHDLIKEQIHSQCQILEMQYNKVNNQLDDLQKQLYESQHHNQINFLEFQMQRIQKEYQNLIKQHEQQELSQQEESQKELNDIYCQLQQLKQQKLSKIQFKYMKKKELTIKEYCADQQQFCNYFLCIFCLGSINHQQKAILLDCLHMFHQQELNYWLQYQNFCPICRRLIN